MTYNCEISERPVQLTVGIHTHSPSQNLPQVIPQTMREVQEYLGKIGQKPSGVPFVAYYNMDMQNLDVEIGFLSAENVPGKDNIQPGSIPAGKIAGCLHVGSYRTIPAGHEALHRWLDENSYECTGAYYELYLNDPAITPEDALQTQIFTVLKPS